MPPIPAHIIEWHQVDQVPAEALEAGMVTMSGVVLAAETYDVEGSGGVIATTAEEAFAIAEAVGPTDGDLVMVRVEYASGQVERHPAGTDVVVLAAVDAELLDVAREAAR